MWLLCPTRAIISRWRSGKPEARQARMIVLWTRSFLVVAAILCLSIFGLAHTRDVPATWMLAIRIVVFGLALSRCNETILAFAMDTRHQLEHRRSRQPLTSVHRLGFVIQSYAEIWLYFGLMACVLPHGMYKPDLYMDVISAIYFSGVTITTLGYGDILPVDKIARMLALYEAFSGLFLIVVAVALYLSQSLVSRDVQ